MMKDEKLEPSNTSRSGFGVKALLFILSVTSVGFLASTIVLLVSRESGTSQDSSSPAVVPLFQSEVNSCADTGPKLDNLACVEDSIQEQAGANVTQGYQGDFNTSATPILEPYFKAGLCPVNVHWHLGAEHLSVGQYDENGTGPGEEEDLSGHRRQLAGEMRQGFKCSLYDEEDAKFTTPFEWKYCKGMQVGQTYEVHWPHSAGGACGTPDQYQTPFVDGVFCRGESINDTPSQIGVQAQVFTVVNDEAFYYPNLMRGMIVDGKYGADVAKYTGSTTGPSRDNTMCSQYAPITWQVDRQCHLISASTFDKMCADMKEQRDDMSADMKPHGSRELVADELAANNHHGRMLRRG